MRPMTAREALEIERRNEDWIAAHPHEWEQASKIMDALVELREAIVAMHRAGKDSESAYSEWLAAEHKLAALERGEEPKTKE